MKSSLSLIDIASITAVHVPTTIISASFFSDHQFLHLILTLTLQYLVIIYVKYATHIALAMCVSCLFVPRTSSKPDYTLIVSHVRFIIITCVALAIFCSDFPMYKKNSALLGKGMDYGMKLMDIGVGMFVANAGFFSPRTSPKRRIKGILIASTCGLLRYLSKVFMKLNVNDREFGTHLNFFFLLAIHQILAPALHSSHDFLVGVVFCIFHDVFLRLGLCKLIVTTTRETLIMANIEGLSFILPQMGVFLIASGLSRACASTPLDKRRFMKYLSLCIGLMVLYRIDALPSRRIHNMPFCMLCILIPFGIGTALYSLMPYFPLENLDVVSWASRHLFFLLIWGNVLVGSFNSLKKTLFKDVSIHVATAHYVLLLVWLPYVISNSEKYATHLAIAVKRMRGRK